MTTENIFQGDIVRMPDGRVGVFVGFIPKDGCHVRLGCGTEVRSRDVELVMTREKFEQEFVMLELVSPMSQQEKTQLAAWALPS